MARPMIEALDDLGGPSALDLSSLFVLASTAVVFSPTVKDRYLELLPDLLIVDAIGSSETGANGMRVAGKGDTKNQGGGPTVQAARDAVVLDGTRKEGPPGRGQDGRRARKGDARNRGGGPVWHAARDASWLSEHRKGVPPGCGQAGRLARRGNVPLAYDKGPERSAATFVVGPDGYRYALAGDMAMLEADGTITLLGRGSQCINSGGEKIFPEEVESALKAHPAVFDAIVVGVPDDRWGQRVAAVVQARDGMAPTLAELDAP